jgi:hypothetical protein
MADAINTCKPKAIELLLESCQHRHDRRCSLRRIANEIRDRADSTPSSAENPMRKSVPDIEKIAVCLSPAILSDRIVC